MPAQKRAFSENLEDDDFTEQEDHHRHHHSKESRRDNEHHQPEEEEEEAKPQDEHEEEEEEYEDYEGTQTSSSEEKPEFVSVELPDIRNDVQCPICLGIIKKTRTVMECLHRFCRECIDKSMRLGNNECPACRTHCASRRSLRDDPNYDALIAVLYPDIDKYEEEELAFHEEERTRNKQIQESIAQIFQRQSEALVRRRTLGKDTAGSFVKRPQRNPRYAQLKKRRNSKGTELQESEENEDENGDNGAKDLSSAEEGCTEVRKRRRKRRARPSQPSSSATNSDGGRIENDLEVSKESRGISPGLVWNPEKLAWGRGGARSNTRHGSASNNSKNSRNTRLSKLVDYLRSLEENNDEFVACQTPLRADEVEILMVNGLRNTNDDQSNINPSTSMDKPHPVPPVLNPSKDELQNLEEQQTLAGVKVNCSSSSNYLVLAYRQKQTS